MKLIGQLLITESTQLVEFTDARSCHSRRKIISLEEAALTLELNDLFIYLLTNRNVITRNTNANHNKNKYVNWLIASVVKTIHPSI